MTKNYFVSKIRRNGPSEIGHTGFETHSEFKRALVTKCFQKSMKNKNGA
jgi:hypothetical protein